MSEREKEREREREREREKEREDVGVHTCVTDCALCATQQRILYMHFNNAGY